MSEVIVSIVMPAYNSDKFISQSIASVLAQTLKSWELLIVIDPKSIDNTESISNSYQAKDNRIRVLKSESAGGVAENRNFAMSAAKGVFVAFLDSDDLWNPSKLEIQVRKMSVARVGLSYHSYAYIGGNGSKLGVTRKVSNSISIKDLLSNNEIGCSTVMVRKDCIARYRFRSVPHEDLVLWLEMLEEGVQFLPILDCLGLYRVGHSSVSSNKFRSAVRRWAIIKKSKLSGIKKCICFSSYACEALIRKLKMKL